ncbi:hypothetical protein GF378_02020 [Candidatus Pacearchaeota archaeon]|nr:hypothetical protein [Candidatus Pacearchaeota archaeon]
MAIKGYCVKCKKKSQEMANVKITQTMRGGYMAKGICKTCGTQMRVMMSKENAEKAIESEEAEKAF